MHSCSKTYDKTEQVAEDRDRVRNDPGNDPAGQADGNPRANRHEIPAMHAVCSAEDSDVDVLEANVAVDHAGANNLGLISCKFRIKRNTLVERALNIP